MPWGSGPATAVAGSVLTAAWLNTNLRDLVNIVRGFGLAMTGQTAGDLAVASGSEQYERLVGSSKTANLQDAVLQRPELRDYAETTAAPTIAAGTLALNLETANCFLVALSANVTTLTLQNPPASGKLGAFTLILTADGTLRSIAWPAAVKWPGGVAPTLTSSNGKKDRFIFATVDGGATWLASNAGQNY